jgi:hypothetical protein
LGFHNLPYAPGHIHLTAHKDFDAFGHFLNSEQYLLALAASAHLRQAAGYARSSRLAWCRNSSPEMKTLFFAEP